MAVTLLEAQDLVALLHRGTLASEPWGDFLAALRRRTGADAALLFLAGPGRGEEVVQIEAGRAPQLVADSALARLSRTGSPLRAKRVFAASDLTDDAALIGLMANRGLAHLRMVRVEEPTGASLWLAVGRRAEDFAAADVALLGMLADHLEIALRTWAALEQERLRAGISGEAIRRLNFGWFLLDRNGAIVDCSAEAEALLHERRAVSRTPSGLLLPERREAQGALRRYLDQLSRGERESRAIHLSDEPWLDMLLTPRAGTAPMVAAYVHGEAPTSAERSAQLMELFGLSAKEAQLALLISRGVTINEATGQLGLTRESARLYSKRLYAKTGTRGQADLVRLVLASVVALS
jgi:DNA-binding CsgD family transcriptional regulator/PAS domain-containing protein